MADDNLLGTEMVKKWLTVQPAAVSVTGLQHQLDRFTRYYNSIRPHRTLDRRIPLQACTARPKAVPSGPVIWSLARL